MRSRVQPCVRCDSGHSSGSLAKQPLMLILGFFGFFWLEERRSTPRVFWSQLEHVCKVLGAAFLCTPLMVATTWRLCFQHLPARVKSLDGKGDLPRPSEHSATSSHQSDSSPAFLETCADQELCCFAGAFQSWDQCFLDRQTEQNRQNRQKRQTEEHHTLHLLKDSFGFASLASEESFVALACEESSVALGRAL